MPTKVTTNRLAPAWPPLGRMLTLLVLGLSTLGTACPHGTGGPYPASVVTDSVLVTFKQGDHLGDSKDHDSHFKSSIGCPNHPATHEFVQSEDQEWKEGTTITRKFKQTFPVQKSQFRNCALAIQWISVSGSDTWVTTPVVNAYFSDGSAVQIATPTLRIDSFTIYTSGPFKQP